MLAPADLKVSGRFVISGCELLRPVQLSTSRAFRSRSWRVPPARPCLPSSAEDGLSAHEDAPALGTLENVPHSRNAPRALSYLFKWHRNLTCRADTPGSHRGAGGVQDPLRIREKRSQSKLTSRKPSALVGKTLFRCGVEVKT
jgi:hypothetical protein